MSLVRFLDQSARAPSDEALFALLLAEAAGYGFDYVAYGQLDERPAARSDLRYPAVMLNYPRGWQVHYFQQSFERIDPIVITARSTLQPYSWADLQATRKLAPGQRALFNAARDFGLAAGCSVPLHGPGSRAAVLSFATASARADPRRHLHVLHLLAVQFDLSFQLLKGTSSWAALPVLTLRERDCLSWIAEGKTTSEVSQILGISENTARFHLKNAMYKLQASSRTAAVARALRLGLIDPIIVTMPPYPIG